MNLPHRPASGAGKWPGRKAPPLYRTELQASTHLVAQRRKGGRWDSNPLPRSHGPVLCPLSYDCHHDLHRPAEIRAGTGGSVPPSAADGRVCTSAWGMAPRRPVVRQPCIIPSPPAGGGARDGETRIAPPAGFSRAGRSVSLPWTGGARTSALHPGPPALLRLRDLRVHSDTFEPPQ